MIFDNNGQTIYRAYSYPINPNMIQEEEDLEQEHDRFLSLVYNNISHNNFGILKEAHTRCIQTPIIQAGNTCYFSTYMHQHCNYRPVHRQSPIYFDDARARIYANQQPNLEHTSCEHIFL